MTTETTQTNEIRQSAKSNRPTHVAKIRHGQGKNASFEQIGAAWINEEGSIYVKLNGTQIVDRGFTLYEITDQDRAGE
jgi:hypothetical protein